jgi:hypothetical protein
LLGALVMAASLVVVPGFARAQSGFDSKPIGKVVTVKGSVTVEHTEAVVVQARLAVGSDKTKIGDPVYKGDVVQTGADSTIGITFTDGTAFTLSSNARMVLNEFVYDPNGKSNSTLISLTKGTFTFFAGKVAKTGDMKIETPVATMGIRGTTPHVEIRDDGTVSFSTLIEEGTKARDKRGVKQRRAEAGSPPVQQAKTESGPNNVSINYKACKGCVRQ